MGFGPMCKKCHKPICSIEMFRFLLISIVELKNGYFCLILPVFWAFPVLGPIITSLASSRSNTDGPSDRKCLKNGQNLAEIPIFLLNNGNRQKPKNFNATTSYCKWSDPALFYPKKRAKLGRKEHFSPQQ